jgi:hypothetical protein
MEGYPGARFGFADVPLLNLLASSGLGELPWVQASSVADAAIIYLPLLETENEMGRT